MALTDKLTAIGNAIRQKTGAAELIPLSDMPNEIGAVYEAGKKSEYDEFWDSFQYKDGALRSSYEYGFYGWRGACFKPKHNLILSGQYNTYTFRHADLFDLAEMTVDRGVAFDTSGATKLNGTFYQSTIGRIPPLDLSSCTSMQSTFVQMLRRSGYTTTDIVLRNLREDCTFATVFDYSSNLENIMIESGAIGQNGFDVSACTKLSKASITSIVNALSENTSGLSVTLSKTAVENAFEKQYGVTLSQSPDERGFYDITLPNVTLRNPHLEFSSLMDIGIYKGEIVEDDWGDKETIWHPDFWDGVDGTKSFELWTDTNTEVYSYTIRRTDGKPVSEEDVVLIDEDNLSEWDNLIATKPNWTISLV